MSALTQLRSAGFFVRLIPPDIIGITPVEGMTDLYIQLVKENRLQLLDELRQAANEADDWQLFVNLVVRHDCTNAEVETMFTDQDKIDLLEEPLHKLPLHAKTIADDIKRKRKPVVDTFHVKRCIDCKHFKRIEHPHLGKCAVGEPEGIAGNWDTDARNYCQSWQAVES